MFPGYVDRHLARFSGHFCPEKRADAGVWPSSGQWSVPAFSLIKHSHRAAFSILAVAIMLMTAGCGSTPKKPSVTTSGKSGGYYLDDGPGPNPPANLDSIPDAVPRNEPFHRGANKPYTVFGKTYVPNVSNDRFRQKGVASWYGRKFHGQKTSNGETYDMYAMSAAHPTLPLPCYVRVTNPANGRAVVVRVNDRGPFLSERIIDLSFAAANRLDIARRGSGQVIVERVFPGDKPVIAETPPSKSVSIPVAPSVSMPDEGPTVFPLPAVPPPLPLPTSVPSPTETSAALPAEVPASTPANTIAASPITADSGALFLQLGAFSSRENAEIFRARMRSELDWNREPILLSHTGGLYRVRLGPYKNRDEAQAIADQVKASLNFSPIISKP